MLSSIVYYKGVGNNVEMTREFARGPETYYVSPSVFNLRIKDEDDASTVEAT